MCSSMEKLLNLYDKKHMRMAMLKHEETFRQQVYELHRLYQVQKILMKKMEINEGPEESTRELWLQQNSRIELDLDGPNNIAGSNIEIIDESEIELTLGPSCYSSRRCNKKLPESRLNLDSGPSFSSSSTGSSNNKKTVNTVNATREESKSIDLEEDMRQERLKQQLWLYQVLSLNIT